MRRAAIVMALLWAGTLVAAAGPAAANAAPSLTVRAAALIEEGTGQLLDARNAGSELAIASTTKLMTALVTLEHVRRLSTVFTQNDYYPAAVDSQIGLVPGERMTVHDLLLAMLLPSADDAAEDLAYNVGHHSVSRFVAMMNVRARQLKLKHTHYSTPIGLDTAGNYSSASDLVKLARFLELHHPFFAHAVAMQGAVLHSGNSVRTIRNRNDLVGRVSWINGIKTGHTIDAGYVLVGSGTQRGMTLISAVLGTDSEAARDSNTLTLLSYGFANFRLVHPVRAGTVVARRPVRDQPGKRAVIIAAGSFTRVIPRGSHLAIRLQLPRQLAGPLPRHAVVGTALVLIDGRIVARIRLLLAQRLSAVSPLTTAARFFTQPITLVVLAAALGTLIGIAVLRRERGRNAGVRPEPAA